MAEIHLLPLDGINGDRIRRLTEGLSAAFEAGEDLGSRAAHIRAAAPAFAKLGAQLQASADRIAAGPSDLGVENAVAAASLKRLVEKCRTLSTLAAAFALPPAEELNETACQPSSSGVDNDDHLPKRVVAPSRDAVADRNASSSA